MNQSASGAEKSEESIDASVILRAVVSRLFRIGLVTVLLLAAAYAVLLFVPRLYESRAELLVEPRSTAYTSAASNQNAETYYIDIATVSSQIELIKSRDTILAAIETAALRDEPAFEGWSDSEIVGEIGDNLVVTQERASRLISVAYRHTDPDLAAKVANAVVQAHVQRRAGQQISDTVDATAWLQQEITRLRQDVVGAERAIADFRVQNDLFTGSNNESLTNQQLSNFSAQITAANERRNAAQSRAQLIRSLLESGQSVGGVSDVQSSAIVQQLSQEMARLQGERAQQAATFLPSHPTIRALDAQIAEIDTQISNEGRRVAQALEAQAQIEADLEQSLQAELERVKVTAGSDTIEGVTLAELEREAAAQRELLNAYLLRFTEASARSDMGSALPDVRVVSEAVPSSSPASPKTSLVLLAVGIAAVLLQVGAVIFSELLSGRALVERPARPEQPDLDQEDTGAAVLDDAGATAAPEAPQPLAITGHRPPATPIDTEIEALAASVLARLDRVILVASDHNAQESLDFAERLTAAFVDNGQSVAEIDAASGQQGIELGLTDLCAEGAEFGDVVHRGADDRFAFVPWGQGTRLNRNTERVATLVEALSDIYEAIVIVTGRVGMTSSLPLFTGIEGKCVLLSSAGTSNSAEAREIAALGFSDIRVIATAEPQSEVA
ncbi:GumC family protein [Pelagibacterium nitratireducens]|uniref:GumC family protein n=1 Tax=Pelagibacterium nitratireducens TaxID=1046114 RepID=A0ABZ2I136_9HYPH|tara:strand:- start:2938 stop:4953 length:2016 start_codon:yes stop_codon:yes gene_type:complete